MNIDSLKIKISKDQLLAKFSQETIMEYFFQDIVRLGRFYVNPFRDDKTPGCRFFYNREGVLVFNDFSNNKQYDFFHIASLRRSQTMTVYDIYNELSGINFKLLPKPTIKFRDDEDRQINTTIKVEIMPYEKSDFDYWAQYNIDLSILKRFNVRRVNKFWINEVLKYIDLRNDPCYRYVEEDRFKLYRPFGGKKYKFRNNYISELEGMTCLPSEGDKLIITKSMKDIMMFYSMGLPAVCPPSETALISETTMKELTSRFKEVFIWFDQDQTGLERSEILYERYKELGVVRLNHNPKLGKDTSDIMKNQGKDKFIEICKQCEIL
jgi:hypothetical protein